MNKNRKVIWLDIFNVSSCCQKDNLERIIDFRDSSWVDDFLSAPQEFTVGMGFIPMRCKTCGRYWFKVPKGYWSVKQSTRGEMANAIG